MRASAWVNATDWDGNRRIVQKGDIGTDDQYRLTAEGGALKFAVAGVGSLTGPLPAVKSWHHVAGTYDGTALCLYEDGVLVASAAASGPIAATSGPLVIGDKPGSTVPGDHFLGAIDGVEVDNVALQPNDFADRTGHAPTPVTAVTAVATSGTGVLLSWGIDGTADGYTVEESTDGTTFTTVTTLATPDVSGLLVTGLSPATGYTFRVTATNAAGSAAARIAPPATTGPADTSGLYQVGGPDAGPDGILPIHHDEARDNSTSAVYVLNSYVEAGSETEAVFQALGGSVTNTATGRSYNLDASNTPAPGQGDRPWLRPIAYSYRVRTPGAPAPAGDVGAFHFTDDYVTTNPGDAGPAGTHVGQALAFEDLWNIDSSQYDWNDDYLRVSVQRVPRTPDGSIVAHYQFSQIDSPSPVVVVPSQQASGLNVIPDTTEGTSIDTNNLILTTLYGTPNSTEYLTRSSSNIDVWADQGASSAILPPGSAINQASISFDSTGTKTVWVGWDGSTGDSSLTTLTILAQHAPQGPPGAAQAAAQAAAQPAAQPNKAVFKRSLVFVVGFAGHSQSLDPAHDQKKIQPTSGVGLIESKLRKDFNYDVQTYPEDPGDQLQLNPANVIAGVCGGGAAGAELDVKQKFNHDGVLHLAAYGHSHGGGTLFKMSEHLAAASAAGNIRNYSLDWTGYIDAIRVDLPLPDKETREPKLTKYHFNRWQSVEWAPVDFGLHGDATVITDGIPNSQANMDTRTFPNPQDGNNLDHTNNRKPKGRGIAENPQVENALIDSLNQRV